jgi:3-oxoisoapionate kinase
MTENLLLAFYGDDFTGSTDAMEALTLKGYRTVLFLEPPTSEMINQFEGLSCVGVAGTSRAKNCSGLVAELRPIMEKLSDIGAKVVHYKTCSTFDSSPETGSIGAAIKVTLDYFPQQSTVPLLVGAPALGRFTLFGNHFAKMNEEVHRLDRHPVMSCHPVTPMDEADLRLHLKKQIDADIALVNILELEREIEEVREVYNEKLKQKPDVILFDVLDDERLYKSGKLIWDNAEKNPFVVGSSGVEYALTQVWEKEGFSAKREEGKNVQAVENILVVSGSASVVTENQIRNAINSGFHGFKIPPELLLSKEWKTPLLDEVVECLQKGESVVLYTALGPNDKNISVTRNLLKEHGITNPGEYIGNKLGTITEYLTTMSSLKRVVIAGGDTSGFVAGAMGIYGLEMLLSVSPGAPLCKVYSDNREKEGMEIALKGGQFGSPDYFLKVRDAKTVE